jgi:DNA-binding CsgD family transcriptional regulator
MWPVLIQERMLAAIESFYDAAMDESLWPVALQTLADVTESQAASFWVMDGSEHPRLPTFICINFDQSSIRDYVGGMATLDPTVRYLVDNPTQAIVHDGLLSDQRDNDTRAYYDWHQRNVETRFRMVGQTRPAPGVQAGVALHRTRNAGRYQSDDIDHFSILQRHLARSLAIGFRIGSLGAMQQVGTEWLDRNTAAVILLDERGRAVFVNRNARAMQSQRDGIRLSADGIGLSRKQDDDKLQRMIGRTLVPDASPTMSSGGSMRAIRPSGKRSYGIFVAPVSRQIAALSFFRPAACVVIIDPDVQPVLPVRRLQVVFGLTEAEARLASLLSAGGDLRSVAAELQITYGTARTRLAQIFQKTRTRRQGELIRLLLTTLAAD